jgi:hypothetical protein
MAVKQAEEERLRREAEEQLRAADAVRFFVHVWSTLAFSLTVLLQAGIAKKERERAKREARKLRQKAREAVEGASSEPMPAER